VKNKRLKDALNILIMNSDINFEERVLESINFSEFMYLISFFYILQMLCSFKTGPINFEKRILKPINVQESMYIAGPVELVWQVWQLPHQYFYFFDPISLLF